MTWISNYIHIWIWDVITHPCPNFNGSLTAIEVRVWMSNYIPHIIMDVITYPCHNLSCATDLVQSMFGRRARGLSAGVVKQSSQPATTASLQANLQTHRETTGNSSYQESNHREKLSVMAQGNGWTVKKVLMATDKYTDYQKKKIHLGKSQISS